MTAKRISPEQSLLQLTPGEKQSYASNSFPANGTIRLLIKLIFFYPINGLVLKNWDLKC